MKKVLFLVLVLMSSSLLAQIDVKNGKIGIGMTDAEYDVQVRASEVMFQDKNSLDIRMYIGSDGKVGIGTTAPAEKLDINGKTKTTQLQITSGAGDGKVLQSDALGNASWVDASSFNNNIFNQDGTLSGDRSIMLADNHFTFSTNIDFPNKNNNDPNNYPSLNTLRILGGNNILALGIQNGNDSRKAWLQVGNNDGANASLTGSMLINPLGGNVGIGTSSPATQLEVQGPNNYWQATFGKGGIWNGDLGGWKRIVFGARNDDGSAEGYDVYLRTHDGSGELLVQDGTGNVGIGTTQPNYRLDVDGTAHVDGDLVVNGQVQMPNYVGANYEGTPNALLGVDASGNVIQAQNLNSGALIQQKFAKTTAARQTINSTTPVKINGLEIPITPTNPNSIIVIEAVIATTAIHTSSFGVFKDGQPTASTVGYDNFNEANMQVSTFGIGGNRSMNNIKVFHFEKANSTTTRTYDIRATSGWEDSARNLRINNRLDNDLAAISYMTVKEVVGEEVINSYTIDPKEQVKSDASEAEKEDLVSERTGSQIELQLESQLQMIEELRKELDALKGTTDLRALNQQIEVSLANSTELEQAYISQNIPNPTSNAAIIKYYIPETSTAAMVRFYSLSGQVIKVVDISEHGQGEIKLDLERMKSGSYMYSFIIDGKLIDTKTMIIVK